MNKKNQPARYWAYSNYLISLRKLIQQNHPTFPVLMKNMLGMKGQNKLAGGKAINRDLIGQHLRQSWFTELHLLNLIDHADILPYSIPWSMTECYYAIHSVLRAYFFATGRDITESHAKTLSTIGSDLVACKNRFPLPWSAVLDGHPWNITSQVTNIPTPFNITQKNAMFSPYTSDPWQYFGLFLKTTRQRIILTSVNKWKTDKNKLRIPPNERTIIINTTRPTSFFDAIYRIRIRSNYKDVDSYLFTSIEDVDYQQLQIAIYAITAYTITVFELLICKILGKKSFGQMVDEFGNSSTVKLPDETILSRWSELKKLI